MIQDFADWLVYGLFGLSADTSIGVAVNFFFYDTIKRELSLEKKYFMREESSYEQKTTIRKNFRYVKD